MAVEGIVIQIEFCIGCKDPEPDGDLDDNSERVTYFYNVGEQELKRCLGEDDGPANPETVVNPTRCEGIINSVVPNPDGTPLFRYFDDSDPPNQINDNASRGQIRTVVITLTVQEQAGLDDPVSRTYTRRVRCRNIGL